MTTTDLLRRAADRLDELASKATHNVCPSWIYWAALHIARNCEIGCEHTEVGLADAPDDGLDHDGWEPYDDAPWIAAMGPQVAAPLAAWLRNTADWASSGEPCPYAEAEELARVILGEEA